MKQYKRSERFNKLLMEEISRIIQRELKDPRIGFASVTRVETTEDLRSAKVHVSLLDEAQAAPTLEALRHAAGLIRGGLMHRIRARRIPELRFVHDRAIEHSVHIAEVLERLRRERGEAPAGRPPGPAAAGADDEPDGDEPDGDEPDDDEPEDDGPEDDGSDGAPGP
jgi:ribosome-binding factor A